MELAIHRIQDEHLRKIGDFDCGLEETMEQFLKSEALAYDKAGEGNTYLIINEKDEIVAYYTIKCNAMQFEIDNKDKVFPAVEISRFAVDSEYQHIGLGKKIFNYILSNIYELKRNVGIKYIMLFSVPDAIGFYEKFNFKKLPNEVHVLPSWEIEDCQGMYTTL